MGMSSSLELKGSWSSFGKEGRSGCLAFFSLFFLTRPFHGKGETGGEGGGRGGARKGGRGEKIVEGGGGLRLREVFTLSFCVARFSNHILKGVYAQARLLSTAVIYEAKYYFVRRPMFYQWPHIVGRALCFSRTRPAAPAWPKPRLVSVPPRRIPPWPSSSPPAAQCFVKSEIPAASSGGMVPFSGKRDTNAIQWRT